MKLEIEMDMVKLERLTFFCWIGKCQRTTNQYAAMRVEVITQKFVLRRNGIDYSCQSAIEPSRQQSANRCMQTNESAVDNDVKFSL